MRVESTISGKFFLVVEKVTAVGCPIYLKSDRFHQRMILSAAQKMFNPWKAYYYLLKPADRRWQRGLAKR
jgi:hypothetical protein